MLRTVGLQGKVAVTVPAAPPSRLGPAPSPELFSVSLCRNPREDGRGWRESDPVSPGRPTVGKGVSVLRCE